MLILAQKTFKNRNKMIQTLTVTREIKSPYNKTTVLRDNKGKVKAIFNSMLKQPRKGTKTIIINCWTFKLDWSNVK